MTDHDPQRLEPGPTRRLFGAIPNPPVDGRVRRWINGALIGLAIATVLIWAFANIAYYNEPDNGIEPFTDAQTYLAAGERLNAGHDLYRLQPGDRAVLTLPGLYSSPLLSPPPIAVLWRPIAAIDLGFALWVAACWVCLLATALYVMLRGGLVGVFAVFALSHAIGEQLAVANANAFMPALYIALWKFRDRPGAGVLVGVAAAIKLAPVAMMGWLVGTSRWRTIAWALAALVALFIVGGLGAGFGSYLDYIGTLPGNQPTRLSISGITGVSWASYAVLALGFIVAVATARRWPRLSFAAALSGAALGTPALYASGLVSLLAIVAPWTGSRHALDWDEGFVRARSVRPAAAVEGPSRRTFVGPNTPELPLE